MMSFKNRAQAAGLLAEKLLAYRGTQPLILGIPRGAVPLAKIIAEKLDGDLDVVLVHKIGAPDNPEFAIGSVDELGQVHKSAAADFYGISDESIQKVGRFELKRLKERRSAYSPVRPPLTIKGRVVIIVDDGIATGSTMLAAIRSVRSQNPKKLVVAAPVASPRIAKIISREVDDVLFLEVPEDFFSISQFYDDFSQVTDEEVLKTLSESLKKGSTPAVVLRKKSA